MEKIIVTRHAALLQFLMEQGLVEEGVQVLTHATAEDVRGKHVYGVLPMRLAAEAALLTEVSLVVPLELRGKELSLENIKACNPAIATYRVAKEKQ